MIITYSAPETREVRVGAYRPHRSAGPLGTGVWEHETIRRRDGEVRRSFQTVEVEVIRTALLIAHWNCEVACTDATREQLVILDRTLGLVPPGHLRLLRERKPEGLVVTSTTGRGPTLSYTGGANVGVDYEETPYDERRVILVTHGALWEHRERGFCPTLLHEIGHVMTHGGELSYEGFPEERRRSLESTRVSRNDGRFEALCNVYMFMLCYGSDDEAVRRFGVFPRSEQNDRAARDGIRGCRAFQEPILDAAWIARFAER